MLAALVSTSLGANPSALAPSQAHNRIDCNAGLMAHPSLRVFFPEPIAASKLRFQSPSQATLVVETDPRPVTFLGRRAYALSIYREDSTGTAYQWEASHRYYEAYDSTGLLEAKETDHLWIRSFEENGEPHFARAYSLMATSSLSELHPWADPLRKPLRRTVEYAAQQNLGGRVFDECLVVRDFDEMGKEISSKTYAAFLGLIAFNFGDTTYTRYWDEGASR